MSRVPSISDAEWEVMNVLWEEHPLRASEVAARLAAHKQWSVRTVKTLIGRLVRKGALAFDSAGRHYLYHPAVGREACVRAESRSFAERVFGGDRNPLLLRMVREADLSQEEIAELRRILGEKEEQR